MPCVVLAAVSLGATGMKAQEAKYRAQEYMMARDAEMRWRGARSTGYLRSRNHQNLTASGYQAVHEGDNGFVCMVMRGFTVAPTFTPFRCMHRL